MLEQPSRVGPAKNLVNIATTFRHFKRKVESATSNAGLEEAEQGILKLLSSDLDGIEVLHNKVSVYQNSTKIAEKKWKAALAMVMELFDGKFLTLSDTGFEMVWKAEHYLQKGSRFSGSQ
jgi:hypothetical protein